MAPLPKGIINVGRFTLLASLGLVTFFVLVSDGGLSYPITFKLIMVSWVAFAVAGATLSAVLLSGLSSKRLWYAFIFYWILLLAFWVGFDLRSLSGTWRAVMYGFAIEIFGPIAYSACGIAYFLTKIPKLYFHFGDQGFRRT